VVKRLKTKIAVLYFPDYKLQFFLAMAATYMPTNSLACLLTSVGNHLATDW